MWSKRDPAFIFCCPSSTRGTRAIRDLSHQRARKLDVLRCQELLAKTLFATQGTSALELRRTAKPSSSAPGRFAQHSLWRNPIPEEPHRLSRFVADLSWRDGCDPSSEFGVRGRLPHPLATGRTYFSRNAHGMLARLVVIRGLPDRGLRLEV